MSEQGVVVESGWRGFWNRGGWWKALLAVVGYLVFYRIAGVLALFASLPFPNDPNAPAGPLGSPFYLFFTLTLPLVFGAAFLVWFVWSVRWFSVVFGPQPVRGRWWMWIFVAVAIIPIVARLVGIDYGLYGAGVVVLVFASGLLVGFTEELLYRGIVVNLLRANGHREIGVAVISSALFAASHLVNLFSGQGGASVGLTVVYTFGFGILMYLAMRVTGSIIAPMLIHGFTDPTTMLATGGIDAGNLTTENPLLAFAEPFNFVIIVAGLLALFFIRGRAKSPAEPEVASTTAD
ncbi:CPBP family intramembrane glutamic endopeptidase [Agromyces sp. NPDC058110]|uniref:CPBP family intramembrane glutamic endopeptidase n=1 Tax=Agromyces sp. NPDC058110 TaxID=3346345 RepID=UPI0036DD0786